MNDEKWPVLQAIKSVLQGLMPDKFNYTMGELAGSAPDQACSVLYRVTKGE
jgi:hypothetical protein